MRVRFGVLIAFAALSVLLYASQFWPWSGIAAMLVAGIPFLLSRPLPHRRLLFKREPLDERETVNLHRTDSIAITIFFGAFLLWLVVGLFITRVGGVQIGNTPFRWTSVALQTIPGFVLVHSISGLVVFSRR